MIRATIPSFGLGEAATVVRRVRVLRHRTLRWFQPPISTVMRGRPSSAAIDHMHSRDEN